MGSDVDISSSIIGLNIGGDCGFSASAPALTASGNNLDSDGSCTGFTLTANPQLGPLADNGGPTLTHALQTGSPAINGAAPYDCVPTDQRGVFRPQASLCDLGSFELAVLSPVVIATSIPTLIPIPTVTATEEFAIFVLEVNGFCRRGPDKLYADVTAFTAATDLNVEGRNAENTWWWIGEYNCWVSDAVGQFQGSPESLPVIVPPPLPEPEQPLVCSADLAEEQCIEAGGTWVESVTRQPYCACPGQN